MLLYGCSGAILLALAWTAHGMDDGLVAWYKFDEGAGDVLRDASGNANHGKTHGAVWVRAGGRFALKFDGEDDYVECDVAKGLDITGPVTLEAWLLPEELPTGEALLLGKDFGSFLLTYSGGNYPARIYWHIAAIPGMSRARAPVGLWHHLVATCDGKVLREYVDGATSGGVRVWKQPVGPAGTKFYMAGGQSGLRHFKGLLSEVRVYRRALSREEAFHRYLEGKAGRKPLDMPRRQPFPPAVKTLNNMVAELLNVEKPAAGAPVEYEFVNPREGWVFVSVSADAGGSVSATLDGAPRQESILAPQAVAQPMEAMRYLPPGPHKLTVWREDGAALDQIVVRAIPELFYAVFPSSSVVTEYGDYSHEFLAKDVLPNVNVLVGVPDEKTEPFFEAWKKQGRRAISEDTAAWLNPKTGKATSSAEEIYEVLVEKPGMQNPLLDGILLDTHDISHGSNYLLYAQAIRKVRDNPAFKDKKIYFYCDCLYGAKESAALARAALDCGDYLAWTHYLHEQPTEQTAREFLDQSLADEAFGWEKYVPGSVARMIVTLAYLTSPGERMNIEPGADFHVLMDMQCNLLVNHPAFAALRGVAWYKSSYADEDAVRWAGRLFRHYFIEGNTGMLSKGPYILDHIQNPDFNQGTAGWTLSPAEEGSMEARHLERYGFQQGRWLETAVGDDFLWTRRSAARPNRFSQEIRNLTPGRLYSLELYTADYKDIIARRSAKQQNAVSITIDDVDLLPPKSFVHVYSNWAYYHLGPYDDEETQVKTWINFHRIVFRAKAAPARLTVSDWATPDNPAGPVGQELMFNFVEVQPYPD